MTDSLMKKNLVKSRNVKSKPFKKKATGQWCHPAETMAYYSKKGLLLKNEIRSSVFSYSLFETNYYYDSSGKAYASVYKISDQYSSNSFVVNGNDSTTSRTTYYEYDKNNRLVRASGRYLSGVLMFEKLNQLDPPVSKRNSYSPAGFLRLEIDTYYERGQVIKKTILKEFDSSGAVFSAVVHDYKNTYNEEGQLTETVMDSDPLTKCVYNYYKNGLVKSRKSGINAWSWKIKYSYYRNG